MAGLSKGVRIALDQLGRRESFGKNTLKAAGAFLAVTNYRKTWVVQGTRGGRSIVVTTLDRGELGPKINQRIRKRPQIRRGKPEDVEPAMSRGPQILRDLAEVGVGPDELTETAGEGFDG